VLTDGRVPAPDMVKLGHCNALVPGPITSPALELVDTAGEHPMNSGMWVATIPIISDTLLMPLDGRAGRNEIHRCRGLW